MCIGASLFIIPPCGFTAVGFWCLVITLTPSTNTLLVLVKTLVTVPFLPLSLPAKLQQCHLF
ncbi:putative membrane protein [[Clostridium] sordellii ATCC 9714]|nr:putative membrane protein [[Clostridium] sordellii ATCC 9714] [Paeniclostridium sordellii ATCC 9714]